MSKPITVVPLGVMAGPETYSGNWRQMLLDNVDTVLSFTVAINDSAGFTIKPGRSIGIMSRDGDFITKVVLTPTGTPQRQLLLW